LSDSVLQCVAVRCCVLQWVVVHCRVLQCVAVCCSVLSCVAVMNITSSRLISLRLWSRPSEVYGMQCTGFNVLAIYIRLLHRLSDEMQCTLKPAHYFP